MTAWHALETAQPDLAAFGRARLHNRVSYLATIRKDGSPRLHPVTPILGKQRLFIFMEPTSPKGHDLRRDPRFALHAGVEDTSGGRGEFLITGRATLVANADLRDLAVEAAPYKPADRYILFELTIGTVFSTIYEKGTPVRRTWRADR